MVFASFRSAKQRFKYSKHFYNNKKVDTIQIIIFKSLDDGDSINLLRSVDGESKPPWIFRFVKTKHYTLNQINLQNMEWLFGSGTRDEKTNPQHIHLANLSSLYSWDSL